MFGLKRAPSALMSAADSLYGWANTQARTTALYAELGAPDTAEGRFELLTLHIVLLSDRLKSGGGSLSALRQAVFDAYISNLDGAMREMGVGDLVMGKRMRKLGAAFYGRAKAYDNAFAALPDVGELEGLIARTVLAGATTTNAGGLARYVLARRAQLAALTDAAMLEGLIAMPVSANAE